MITDTPAVLPDLTAIPRDRLDQAGGTVLANALRRIQDGEREPALSAFNSNP